MTKPQKELLLRAAEQPGFWVERFAYERGSGWGNYRSGDALVRQGLMRQSLRRFPGSYVSRNAYGFVLTEDGLAAASRLRSRETRKPKP